LIIKVKLLARKILYYNLILQALFQSAQHLYEKKGRIRIRTSDLQIRKTQKLTDPKDPKHWIVGTINPSIVLVLCRPKTASCKLEVYPRAGFLFVLVSTSKLLIAVHIRYLVVYALPGKSPDSMVKNTSWFKNLLID